MKISQFTTLYKLTLLYFSDTYKINHFIILDTLALLYFSLTFYRNASNKRPGAYLIFYAWGGRLFEDGRLFKAKIWGQLFDIPVSRVGAYSRVGT